MRRYQIYLAGACAGLTMEEQNEWRKYIKRSVENIVNEKVYCINPVDFYDYESNKHITEKEIMNFDLNKVRNSNLIIVNFTNKSSSIGTAMELAVASELRIPIIGINEDNQKLHPWLEIVCDRIFDDINDAIDYVFDYHLIAL